MSIEKNKKEATRWYVTALEDLAAAEILLKNGKYSHACFLCQQAAEKSMKAIHYFRDGDPWGHSVYKLTIELKNVDSDIYDVFAKFIDYAKSLDRLYIPTRYPNGLPDITPNEAFLEKDADEALKMAGEIIEAVRRITNPDD